MDQVWFVAALWLLLAVVAALVANWLRVSTALSEIVVGVIRMQKKVASHEGTGA